MGLGEWVRQAFEERCVSLEIRCRPINSEGWLEQGYLLGRENGKKECIYVQGRRVPITKSEFQGLCDLHDEGTFIA